ncbi:MAG: ATP-binding protein [Rhodospirillaceae bacterium]|nr:ATP-binding protein [Rhodospirillaceae bacterium]
MSEIENQSSLKTVQAGQEKLRVGLSVGNIFFALILVIITAAAVYGPWHFASRDNTEEMIRQLTDEIVASVSLEANKVFSSAIAAQGAIRRMLTEGAFDIKDRAKREPVFMSFLLANRHFSWVSFGKPDGDFYGAQRLDGKNYRLVESIWNPDTRTASRQIMSLKVDSKDDILPIGAEERQNIYNATQRQWYKRAIAQPDSHVWTSVYIFATSGIPGLNSAITFRKDSELVGVVSIAIELERISRYLGTIKSVRSGAAFIINREGRMIAFKNKSEVTRTQTGSSRLELTPLNQTKNPILKIASAALDTKNLAANKKQFRLYTEPDSGKRYFVNLTPLAKQDWFIGTVIPEADFTAALDDNYVRLVAALGVVLLFIAFFAIWFSRRLFIRPLHQVIDETNLVESLAEELKSKNASLESTLSDLEKAQDQIITREKLAALGELTAGVAHEIKNPLNFIKNFSEVSGELLNEMLEEISRLAEERKTAANNKDDVDGQEKDDTVELIEEIAGDLTGNLETIQEHAQRANNIVQSMLQMGRGSSQRLPANINVLLSEHANLAYHSARADDSDFNIEIQEDFDSEIGEIEVIPQDLSRVFLNMVTNACYATHEKQTALKKIDPDAVEMKEGDVDYKPLLQLMTRNLGGSVEIRVRDNGNGIPDEVVEKIFLPFFTTKPTNEGTGLGLALSNDIIRRHGGTIRVETKTGEFTEMIIELPKSSDT